MAPRANAIRFCFPSGRATRVRPLFCTNLGARRLEYRVRGRPDIPKQGSKWLSHHLTSVCLDRDLTNVELATDLLIQQAGGYQGHDLPFARRSNA